MRLFIDAGNTRVKWAFHDGRGWRASGSVDNGDIASMFLAWQGHPRPDEVIGSNVAGEGVRTRLETQLSRWRVQPRWITSKVAECGVTNSYRNPAQLGTDRWAALIAARHLHGGNCVVVNAGTAITVDALTADGVFLGGIILPGLELMNKALASNTAALRASAGHYQDFPDSTPNALFSGALNAVAGAIERFFSTFEGAGHPDAACILSGGNAAALAPQLRIPSTVTENLVLEGLLVIAGQ